MVYDETHSRITDALHGRTIENIGLYANNLIITATDGKLVHLEAGPDKTIRLVDSGYLTPSMRAQLRHNAHKAPQQDAIGKTIDYCLYGGQKFKIVTVCGHDLTFQAAENGRIFYYGMGVTVNLQGLDLFGVQGVVG